VTVRHILLATAAALVLGLGLYLFHEVHATPATADVKLGPRTQDSEPGPADVTPAADHGTRSGPTLAVGSGGSAIPGRFVRRPQPGAGTRLSDPPDSEVAPPPDPGDLMRPQKLDIIMAEANKAYDRGDFDDARTIAQKVLQKSPGNARMLRILVSAACIEGDGPEAQKHFGELSASDREQMKTRCAKYGVTFTDPPKP
jgi:hypothetical protein